MKNVVAGLVCIAGILISSTALFGQISTTQAFQTQITLSDPCAVFAVSTGSTNITRITYGESINFAVTGSVTTTPGYSNGLPSLTFEMNAHGAGVGATSGIKYLFNAKELIQAPSGTAADPFIGSFKIDTRMIGQGNKASVGQIAQGAQDNAVLHFSLDLKYAGGITVVAASQFSLECAGSPWTNLMDSPLAGTNVPVGRGFGDPWSKYAWSIKDFGGGLVVGTRSAFYNFMATENPSATVQACIDNPALVFPSIYKGLACLELLGGASDVGTRNADIWRYDYAGKNWTHVLHDPWAQGYRAMEIHNGKLYVGSDLGSFITGVQLYSAPPWFFPGSRMMSSVDGKTFVNVDCPAPPAGPCGSGQGNTSFLMDVNTSFRGLASFNGKLYLGTFNPMGAELWSYEEGAAAPWKMVKKWNPYKPAIAELKVYNSKLYIGFAGTSDYLYTMDATEAIAALPSLPTDVPAESLGVLKLYVAKGLLYVGNVDLTNGFNLHTYDGSTWKTITTNGFYNSNNAYAWSMVDVGKRVFVGTFNQDFLTALPRGSAELWFSDDNVNWQQAPLPVNWGLWNYGIRSMTVGDGGKTVFFGTASNMIAPDLIMTPLPLSPGLEVWSMSANSAVKQ